MRPTRRGVGVLLVAGAAVAIGTQFGQQALGAVAGPLLVALGVAAGQVYWAGTPTVERQPPRRGFPGERRTVELTVDGSGVARITDRLSRGIDGAATTVRSLPASVSYDVTYERRGEHRVGPVDVRLTDSLGLVAASTTVDVTDDVLVYPPVYRLGGPEAFVRTLVPDADDRQAFDRLREYVPGDSLRDVHWKSSAKRDDLLVKEFADRNSDRGLVVVAEADDDYADEMAAAAATVTMGALESGLAVELVTPGGSVDAGYGDTHRVRLLETLARTGAGTTGRSGDADVLVTADDDGVTVTVEGQQQAFEDVTVSHDNPLAGEVGS
ncbi:MULTISPECIES: DUF58 domain-containing protein [Haloarcula]|uniref:DUF58 domain-containing protein n=1 Tax=Haloarcula pellucida TaxID=1427151 RepID=A0A830GN52_9EURY|nr:MULTISPECIES: DUF58 domain-containing protein [Halomicroarcula]MBX0348961.1 DUF58 domain-containing protein [Halomicroarcula pellucida]MDS0279459.1 DUF58 domain-containing protein [Halomicroarcula sp. S1AR25-4]GGN98370.1 hypothetical protein GCM10009030_28660 [Halomicroarcula pellucida]